MKKIIIISVLVYIIITIIILLIIKYKNKTNEEELSNLLNNTIEYDKLLSVRYSSSGDSFGNTDIETIDIENKILKKEYSPAAGVNLTITEYKVTDKDIEKIEKILKKGILNLSNLPQSDEIALDAPSTSYSFTFDNTKINNNSYESYLIDYNTKIPRKGYDLLNELNTLFNNIEKDENIIKVYTEE